jgi:hypothetical protein
MALRRLQQRPCRIPLLPVASSLLGQGHALVHAVACAQVIRKSKKASWLW